MGFIDFIKSIFQPVRETSGPKRDSAAPGSDFNQVFRREVGAFGRGGDADPLPEPQVTQQVSSSVAAASSTVQTAPAAAKAETKVKFFPLKMYRQSNSVAGTQAGVGVQAPAYLPLVRSAGYPLRVSNSTALNRFQQVGTPGRGDSGQIGELSAQFESGEDGVGAIGYDPGGGTSYGTYQIASRPGSMKEFINYLEDRQPEWARRLKAAGRANTGSTRGAMPTAWKRIAEENPSRFEDLQRDFVRGNFHEPAAEAILQDTGLDVSDHSKALQEVLWSTAVQHGAAGARKIFSKALRQLQVHGRVPTDEALIEQVYQVRAQYAGGLSAHLKASVQDRFREERSVALSMLRERRFQV